MTASTRRAALGAILAAPLASVPAVASAPSDLARACDWAIGHEQWISAAAHDQDWDDARLDAEIDKCGAVFRRALSEPSASLSDLAAKARLSLQDRIENCPDGGADDGERLVFVVLREIIALET